MHVVCLLFNTVQGVVKKFAESAFIPGYETISVCLAYPVALYTRRVESEAQISGCAPIKNPRVSLYITLICVHFFYFCSQRMAPTLGLQPLIMNALRKYEK